MKRVLVTGAGGQLGKSLAEAAGDFPGIRLFRYTAKELDITDREAVRRRFGEDRPDYCINCAAFTDVDGAEKEPEKAMAVNARGVANVAGVCAEQQTVLIHISTDYVFDGTKKAGYTTTDPPNPINVYGTSKLEGERIIQNQLERFFIIRTSWLYSPKYGANFYRTIVEKAKKGVPLQVTTAQVGCPTRAGNLARYILGLIENNNQDYGLHHFTDGEAMTWYAFAKRILKDEGLEGHTQLRKVRNYRTFAQRPDCSILLKG